MADDYKKQVADFYRTEYKLPVDATDDEIIDFAKNDNPDALKEVTSRAYGHAPTVQEQPQSIVGSAIQAASETADEINKQTQDQANRAVPESKGARFLSSGDMSKTLDSYGVLANKALAKGTKLSKAIGEDLDSAVSDIDKVNEGLPPGVKQFAQLGTSQARNITEVVASLFPRTPMQSVFTAITTPTSDLQSAGNAVGKFLGTMGGEESAIAAKTAMGAIRSPAEKYPESKLAASVEKFLQGSEGSDRFNLINKSEVNKETRRIGAEGITEAEKAREGVVEGHVVQKLEQDTNDVLMNQRHDLDSIYTDRAGKSDKFRTDLADKKQTISELENSAHTLAVDEQKALKVKEAKEASIKADLATDNALGMVAKTQRGVQISRDTVGAITKAQKEVSVVYELAHEIAGNVEVDVKGLAKDFADKFNQLGYQLALLPQDTRALKLLDKLKTGTEYLSTLRPPTAAEEKTRLGFIQGLSKQNAAEAAKIMESKPEAVTLSDLQKMYKDLNALSREKGDSIYAETRDIVGSFIRKASTSGEGVVVSGKGALEDAQIAGNLWDRARQARMHLDSVAQNKTIQDIVSLTGKEAKGDPSKALGMLVGKDAEVPLQDFLRVAPKETQQVVRRESLRSGFQIVQDAPGGKALDRLNKFIADTGKGNFTLLHGGIDEESLRALASAQDSIHRTNSLSPGIKRQVNATFDEIQTLITKEKDSVVKAGRDISDNKNSVLDNLRGLQDKARNDIAARKAQTEKRIADSLAILDKTFEVRTKPDLRPGMTGKVVVDMARRDDGGANTAIGTGMLGIGVTKAAEMAGMHIPGATGIRNMSAMAVAYGIVRKSPRAFSNIYYSPSGRALMEKIASAPTAKDAAVALMQLAKVAGPTGMRLGVLSNLSKNQPNPQEQSRGDEANKELPKVRVPQSMASPRSINEILGPESGNDNAGQEAYDSLPPLLPKSARETNDE